MFFNRKKKQSDIIPFSNIMQQENNTETSIKEDEYLLDCSLKRLNNLVGMEKIKEDINGIIQFQKLNILREEKGLAPVQISNHLVFKGNPGTGKTTVARIIADIYKALNIVSRGQLIETDRSGLVGRYQGETEAKTKEVIESAYGGVLFIDEAYTLAHGDSDYGQRAIEIILKEMEDHRDDLIVIAAGYREEMDTFLASNPGLASRFGTVLDFEDYTPNDLFFVMEKYTHQLGYLLDPYCYDVAVDFFVEKAKQPNFANARLARSLVETAMKTQASRLANSGKIIKETDFETICTITKDDLHKAICLL